VPTAITTGCSGEDLHHLGDHDLTANTVHMVLGRIEGAPPG